MRSDALEVLRPADLDEALRMLGEQPLTPLAGGTDLFVAINAGACPERRFIDLWPLDELRGIRREGDELIFGALVTYSDCIRSKKVSAHLPILAEAAREVGGVQIQNRGTLGGNIGNGSPAGDSLPVLMAADARVMLRCKQNQREVPLAEFYTGYRAAVRRPDELIVGVRVPIPDKRARQRFRKVGTRAAQAISKVVIAAVGDQVAFGSVGPTVVRAARVEAYWASGGRDVAESRRLLYEDIRPIDDLRSTAEYRRRVAANLLEEVMRS
jgi:CO/xanthine dehydrogenase FAD-binding subunit